LLKDKAATIVKYGEVMKTEVNPSDHYRRDLIVLLCRFSKHDNNNNDKPFKITSIYALVFLNLLGIANIAGILDNAFAAPTIRDSNLPPTVAGPL
jgi:hypothetical protein